MKKVKVRAPKLPCIGCGKNTAIGLCRTCRLIDLFGSMLTAICSMNQHFHENDHSCHYDKDDAVVDSTSLLRR